MNKFVSSTVSMVCCLTLPCPHFFNPTHVKFKFKSRVSTESIEDTNILQSRYANHGANDDRNSFSAAFVDFGIPKALTSALIGNLDTPDILSANSRNSRGIVFVPCSLDSNVAGSYTLTIYSSAQLSWKSAPLYHLLNPVKPFSGIIGTSRSSPSKRRMPLKKKTQFKDGSEIHDDFWKETDDEDSMRGTFSFSSDDMASDTSHESTGAQRHVAGVNDNDEEGLAGGRQSFSLMIIESGNSNCRVDSVGEMAGRWHGGGFESNSSPTWGGCRNYNTWLMNPTFAIVCPEPSRLRIILECEFPDLVFQQSQNNNIPTVGMYLLAGDKSTAKLHGSYVLDRSGFSQALQDSVYKQTASKSLVLVKRVWDVVVPGAQVPWVLLACTYQPKVEGSFKLLVERRDEEIL